MRHLDKNAVPTTDPRVQRRRYAGQAWLFLRHSWLALDPPSDTVWLGCLSSLSIESIIHKVAENHSFPLNEAVAATVVALQLFREHGFILDPSVQS